MSSRTRRVFLVLAPVFLLVAVAFSCGACNPPAEIVRPDDLRTQVPGATALVVVYSRTGNTARVARGCARALGADFLRLQGEGGEGGSWFTTPLWTSTVKGTPGETPLEPYRLVLIGGPVWYWHPNALTTSFIKTSDLRGKDVVLFYTFEGGEMSAETERTWKQWVVDRGGTVIDLVGIDRKKLGPDASLEKEAERIAREHLQRWTSSRAKTEASPTP